MPITGGTGRTGRVTMVRQNSGKKVDTDSSTSGSDAKTETTPPRKVNKVTITPKQNGQKKEVETKLQSREIKVPVMTERKPSVTVIPNRRDSASSASKSPSVPSSDQSRSPSIASTDKSRSVTPAKAKAPLKKEPPVKEPSPELDSDELDSSEYEEITVTETEESEDEIQRPITFVPLRKVSKDVAPKEKSTTPEPEFVRPILKKVEKKPEPEKVERPTSPEPKFVRPQLRKVKRDPSKKEVQKEKFPAVELKKAPPKEERELRREPTIPSIQEIKQENLKKIPPPPPPPPPPGKLPPPDFEKKNLSETAKKRIEQYKKRPRKRPDWSDMMKEVEEGKQLRHVDCNDRSHPIIQCKSMTKVENKFVFETEKKDTKLNALLKEIQSGVKLKPVVTNDRSKPVLDGLRKFKRQLTVEEQIQRSESKAQLESLPPSVVEPVSDDDVEDIDKLRDDLQSTKQMLALELRNKEAKERENKRLAEKIKSLEAELELARSNKGEGEGTVAVTKAFTDDDPLVKALKKEADEAHASSKLLEKKYQEAAEKLDIAKAELEEQKKIVAKFIAQHKDGNWDKVSFPAGLFDYNNYSDIENEGGQLPSLPTRRESEHKDRESSPEPTFTDSEDNDEEGDDEEKKRQKAMRSLMREIKLLRFRLDKYKEKETAAKKERQSLKDQMKSNQKLLKEEKKKFRKLQKEVEKMADVMKDVEEEEGEEAGEKEEQPKEEEPETVTESEESEESESDESEVSDACSESENEDAPDSRKKKNLEPRVKRHENRLGALKKGNLLLFANVERLKDEINKQKEMSNSLQRDLDSVISDLGL